MAYIKSIKVKKLKLQKSAIIPPPQINQPLNILAYFFLRVYMYVYNFNLFYILAACIFLNVSVLFYKHFNTSVRFCELNFYCFYFLMCLSFNNLPISIFLNKIFHVSRKEQIITTNANNIHYLALTDFNILPYLLKRTNSHFFPYL